MDIQEVIAREEIRMGIADYCVSMDTGEMDRVLSVFAPEAIVEMYGYTCAGIDEIRSTLASAGKLVLSVPDIAPLRHFVSTQSIRLLSPQEASSTTYVTVVGSRGVDHWGAYIDRWAKSQGQWRIARRSVTLDGFMKGSAGEKLHARAHHAVSGGVE